MSLLTLSDLFLNIKNNDKFTRLFQTEDNCLLSGQNQGMQNFLVAGINQVEEKFCVIVPEGGLINSVINELTAYGQKFFHLKAREEQLHLSAKLKYSREAEQQRTYILSELARGRKLPFSLLVEGKTLLQVVPKLTYWQNVLFPLTITRNMEPEVLEEKLLQLGYEKKTQVENEGDFARRGDIFDVWPIGLQYNYADYLSEEDIATIKPRLNDNEFFENIAIRLSFFGDEIDEAKLFSVENQRSFTNLNSENDTIWFYPAKEVFLFDKDSFIRLEAKITSQLRDLQSQKSVQKHQEQATAVSQYLKEALAFLKNKIEFTYDPWLEEVWGGFSEGGIFSYLAGFRFCFYEANLLMPSLIRQQKHFTEIIRQSLLQNKLPESSFSAYYGLDQFFGFLKNQTRLIALASLIPPKDEFALLFQEKIVLSGLDVQTLVLNRAESYLQEVADNYQRNTYINNLVLVICIDNLQGHSGNDFKDKLSKLWLNQSTKGKIDFYFADLPIKQGFYAPELDVYLLGYDNLEGISYKQRRRKTLKNKNPIFFGDLQFGDYVVHDIHGIARYEGVVTLTTDGVKKRDYLKLAYAGEDCLFIPMEALYQVQKYRGVGSDSQPKLTRLGTNDWAKLKDRARNSTKALAINLVSLYAKRFSQNGFAFQKFPHFEDVFADSFPYEETDDQLRCLAEIYQDMERNICMDRLLCGDVGFGKTELAFRSLFRAVCNNKQALMVAPTTVLCHQHFLNLQQRLKGFPVRVEELSRFVNPSKQREVIKAIKTGEVDILISTHRSFSQDIQFRDLGLLIIDEEQRFGVEHKEKTKEIYPLIDVLTLSATPIPRTLHMGLSGIRDISLLQDPPQNRRAVMTYVLPHDLDILQEAIDKEIARNGQVFYLYNNTYKIAKKAEELKSRMPNLRIAIAHGKMSEANLERVIEDFLEKKYDLLLCTTIIESGIDMPNVNTIIVEGAEKMGLSGLYQLRGRVGRSQRQAYAYFTYRADGNLTEKAIKRLTAIRDYTSLGSGFKIAMRDLEARGAGNVLGAEQHGQLEAVGYDLYCRMLAEELAIAKERMLLQVEQIDSAPPKKQEPLAIANVNFEIDLDAYLSKEYISDEAERMDVYRLFAEIKTYEQYQDAYDYLLDRYGEPDGNLQNLLDFSYCRNVAAKLLIDKIYLDKEGLHLQFSVLRDFPALIVSKFMENKENTKFTVLNMLRNNTVELLYKREIKNKKDFLNSTIKIIRQLEGVVEDE